MKTTMIAAPCALGGRALATFVLLTLLTVGCRDVASPLPVGTLDPNTIRTPEGAFALYRGALNQAQDGVGRFIQSSGLLTDELTSASLEIRANPGVTPPGFDSRNLDRPEGGTYAVLHGIRNQARQARFALARYAPPQSASSFRGELYALEAYADVLLAELFCSGTLLSTVDFDGDWTYTRAFTTTEVYEHAVALFDSALSLSADSARIHNFARVGRGRALLGLGRFTDAAQSVHDVPTAYIRVAI